MAAPGSLVRRAARAPLVHFVLLGAVVYAAARGLWPPPVRSPEPVVIRDTQLERLTRDWVQTVGRAPTELEVDRMVEDLVEDELLFREALARGLQYGDPVVERRLIANQRFVERGAGAPGNPRPDAQLLRDARALGMDRTDPVVRRRLIDRMRQRVVAADAVRDAWPAETGARAPSAAPAPPRVALSHVFLSRDARGARAETDASALRETLVREALTPAEARARDLGDPLLLPSTLPPSTQSEIAARFGSAFAAQAFELPLRRWSDPIPSTYGVHLVYLHERIGPAPGDGIESAGRSADASGDAVGRGGDRDLRERLAVRNALTAIRRATPVVREGERTGAGPPDTH